MRRFSLLTAGALCASALTASASVTPQGWWRFGEVTPGNTAGDYAADSSGKGRRFRHAFSSTAGGGNAGGIISPFGVGGPLGTTGATSTNCCYWLYRESGAGGMWNPGNDAIDPQYGTGEGIYNPPPTNYVIECWLKPNPDVAGSGKFFMSGSTDFSQPNRSSGAGPGGVFFRRANDASIGGFKIGAFVLANAGQGVPSDTQIGDYVDADPTRWMHVAVVNDNGTNRFYVNGVARGAPQPLNTIPNGNIFAGCQEGTYGAFHGYLDEFRMSTFAPGAFSTNDLLLRPAGPNILTQPQSTTVWSGGAAPFSVAAALDTVSGYQWQRNSTNIPNATNASVTLPLVTLADSATPVRCILTDSGINVTSAVATVTVVAPNTANTAAYRAAVTTEPSLVAYFPADDCIGTTVTNVADATRLHDGTLEGNANYDGRTNLAFGQRALAFNLDGDVTIPNNPAYEFSAGTGAGTIEALIYLSQAATTDPTIFAEAYDYGSSGTYYAFRAKADGLSLVWTNDSPVNLSWPLPASLLGRWTHVALVIDHGTNVTAYANGLSLGTKVQSSFGSSPGGPAWIGSTGLNNPGYLWPGAIDELAFYTTALPASTIAIHNSKFLYGTNTSAPTITSLPATGSKTLLAGGSASFTVGASGTAPLTYQWTTNGIPIPGANAATLTLSPTTLAQSGTYGVTVSNPYGVTNSPTFTLAFGTPGDSYATKVMRDNPSAFWRLDETGGTNGAPAYDQAGGHDGTYIISTPPGYYNTNGLLPGVADKAVRLVNPGASLQGRVEVPYSPALNPNGPYTIECFANPNYDGANSGGYLVSSQYRVGTARWGYMLGASANSEQFDYFLPVSSTSVPQIVGGPHCYAGVTVHVAGVYDGTNGYLYVNGVLAGQMNNPAITFNPSAPLEIGVRNGGAVAYDGIIDEVAFYGYALSANQVSNHWSSLFTPAAISRQPVGVTNIEGSTITLTAATTGYVNTYQWFNGATALTDAPNYDATQHYPNSVVNPTLTITQATPSDSGDYKLVVYNAVGGATTVTVKVSITNDLSAPVVTAVQALGTPNAAGPSPYLVKVLFNKRIYPGYGTYSIGGGPSLQFTLLTDVRAAMLGADWREVIVQTTGLTPGQSYTLNVSGVRDQTVSLNQIVTTNITFRAPLFTQGLLVWDYYYLGSVAVGVAALTGNPIYPIAPMTNGSSSSFDTTPITGGDLRNKGYGALGDNYGDSLSGWITPTVSGDYTFFLNTDDASELWLSGTADPAGASLIAYDLTCCHPFQEKTNVNVTYTSDPVPLVKDQSYFIRALHTEGGGGDYLRVAWRIAGATNAPSTLLPIPAAYLSSYAPGPIGFKPLVFSGGQLTISWTGTATLLQSTNVAAPMSQWAPAANTSPYTVTPSGPQMFYRLTQ